MSIPDPGPSFAPGQLVGGRYRILRLLGEGGMGQVFLAEHLVLNQQVALKLMRPAHLENATSVARFEREARAAAGLRGDHSARVFDAGRIEDGTPFLAMEFLEGIDLEAELRQRGQLTTSEAVGYVLQTCTGLAEAHAKGIVHRDLKPANLFLARRVDGTVIVKIVDFGIAKWTLNDGSAGDLADLTKTAVAMGSPAYMSPEQIRSARTADARTDIWSLGVILYQLVVGSLPFPGSNATEVLARVLTEPPVDPSTIGQAVPPELQAVIMRCLAKNRDERYQTVAEMSRALMPLAGTAVTGPEAVAETVSVAEVPRSASPSEGLPPIVRSTTNAMTVPMKESPARTRRGIAVGALCVAVVAATWAAVSTGRSGDLPSTATTRTPAAVLPARPAVTAAADAATDLPPAPSARPIPGPPDQKAPRRGLTEKPRIRPALRNPADSLYEDRK